MSDGSTDSIQLEELNCSVCQEPYGDEDSSPRMLNCGHTFCTRCLKAIIKEKPFCPDCRVPIRGRNVTFLPIAYIVKQIIESVNELNKQNLENELSSPSEDCNTSEVCSGILLNNESDPFPSVGTCPTHKAPQQFRCTTCNKWICGSCAFLDHHSIPLKLKKTLFSSRVEKATTLCQIVLAPKYFETLKNQELKRITNQIMELENGVITVGNFAELIREELVNIKLIPCTTNLEKSMLDKHNLVLSALLNKKKELEVSLEVVEESKDKFKVSSLMELHKAIKYLDDLWACYNYPQSEDEIIEGVFSCIINKVPYVLMKGNPIIVSLRREDKRLYSTIKFEKNYIILPSLKDGPTNGTHVVPFHEIRHRSKKIKAFFRLGRQGIKLGTIEIAVFDNRRSEQFVMLCTGEKGPSYKWTKFFAAGGLFTQYLSGGDYEKNNGSGGAKIIDDIGDPYGIKMEDGIVCGEGSYQTKVLAQFKIFYKVGSSPFARCPIGKVVQGLSLVRDIANEDYEKVYIEECGIMIPINDDE